MCFQYGLNVPIRKGTLGQRRINAVKMTYVGPTAYVDRNGKTHYVGPTQTSTLQRS
jgi:hypothetical protein